MSPPPIDFHSSAAHAEHSAIVPSCVLSLLHYQVPVKTHSLESVAICMSSQIESRAVMPACSKWRLYDYEASAKTTKEFAYMETSGEFRRRRGL
jgi:hypothetical protein